MKKTIFAAACMLALAACSSTPTAADVMAAKATADQAAATAGADLPQACLAVTAAHDLFLVAASFSPAVGVDSAEELTIYTNLTTGAGLCSAATLAHPPADTVSAVKAIVAQVMQIHDMAQLAVVASSPVAK